jgi:hypothetical protein
VGYRPLMMGLPWPIDALRVPDTENKVFLESYTRKRAHLPVVVSIF